MLYIKTVLTSELSNFYHAWNNFDSQFYWYLFGTKVCGSFFIGHFFFHFHFSVYVHSTYTEYINIQYAIAICLKKYSLYKINVHHLLSSVSSL